MANIRKLAVIGDPIAHSLSPVMQNIMIAHFDLPFRYEALHVKAGELPEIAAKLRTGELAGINVTIPHKEKIIELLDKLEPPADRIGAVNTVVGHDGVLTGHNTDASGFQRSLRAAGFPAAHEQVLVLGAGGAAAAVVHALLQSRAAAVYLCNRTRERAHRLAASFEPHGETVVACVEWEDRMEWMRTQPVTMIVNTTSVGMYPDTAAAPLPPEAFNADQILVDLVYNPVETMLIKHARTAGAVTLHGLAMLIFQGVASLELWSGEKLDLREVFTQIEAELMKRLRTVN